MSKFETVLKNINLSNSPYQYQNYTFHLFFEDDEILKIMHKTKHWREVLKTNGAFFTGLEYLEKETDFNELYACFATDAKRTYADDVINIIYIFTSVASSLLNLPDQTLKLIPSHQYLYEYTAIQPIPYEININKVDSIQINKLRRHLVLSEIAAVVMTYEYDKNLIDTTALKSKFLLENSEGLDVLFCDYINYMDIDDNDELKNMIEEIFGIKYKQSLGLLSRSYDSDEIKIFDIVYFKNKN